MPDSSDGSTNLAANLAANDLAARNNVETVYRLASPCEQLAVEYRWLNDRFVHRVLVGDQVALSSVDGDGTQEWPASPPIQQISLEPIENVSMILGVGGAGRGHWSISVGWQAGGEIDGRQFDGGFCFDMACRVKDQPEFLGSTYAINAEADRPVKVSAVLGTEKRKAGEVSVLAAGENMGATYRWGYLLSLADLK